MKFHSKTIDKLNWTILRWFGSLVYKHKVLKMFLIVMFPWYETNCYADKLHPVSSYRSELNCGEDVQCMTIEPIVEARLSESANDVTDL